MQRLVSSFWDRLAGCITGIYDTSSRYSCCPKVSHILTGACKRTRSSRPIDAPQNLSLLANPSHAAFVGVLRHSRPSLCPSHVTHSSLRLRKPPPARIIPRPITYQKASAFARTPRSSVSLDCLTFALASGCGASRCGASGSGGGTGLNPCNLACLCAFRFRCSLSGWHAMPQLVHSAWSAF